MQTQTANISPKAIAAAIAALIVPFVALRTGLDEGVLSGAVTAIVTAIVTLAAAYLAPPGDVVPAAETDDIDDPGDASDALLGDHAIQSIRDSTAG